MSQQRPNFILMLTLLACGNASAVEWSGYVVGTSDYVYRGATQSDGDPALQLGADVSFSSGVFFGAWASTVDLQSPVTKRDTELRLYLGYGFDINNALRLTLSTVAYRYPGSEGAIDYDNQEVSVSLGINDTYWLEYAYSPDLYDTGWDTHNVEAFAEGLISESWSLSGGVGFYRVQNLASSDTVYWNIGVSRAVWDFDLDLRYHTANETIPFVSNSDQIGSRVALSVRYGF